MQASTEMQASIMFPNPNSKETIRNQWARIHARHGITELFNEKIAEINKSPALSNLRPFVPYEHLPEVPPLSDPASDTGPKIDPKVAIVGAGAAGLFTAMILDYLNKNDSLKEKGFKVSYDIFEAADKDRVGGRLFTYNFAPHDVKSPAGRHDYYDVGAMRFPENKVMTRCDVAQFDLSLVMPFATNSLLERLIFLRDWGWR